MKRIQYSHIEIADLCQQLALLLRSGVRTPDALFLVAEEEPDKARRSLLESMARSLDAGSALSDVFVSAGCFPTHVTGLLAVGQRVGRTEQTLFALSRYYTRQHTMERQLKNALTYPAVLLLLMLVVIVVLLSKVLPVFQQVYASLGGSLTGLAGGLLTVGNWLNTAMPVLIALFGLLVLAFALFSFCPALRKACTALWQRKFGDRGVSRKMHDAQFAEALAMAVASGMPMEEGITLAAGLLADSPAATNRLNRCRQLLDEGQTLAVALQQSQMLPAPSCRMLSLGLQAGTGDTTTEEIARRLDEDAREALESKVSRIEPALVLVTSLLVGAILLSVMLPLMNIMKVMG